MDQQQQHDFDSNAARMPGAAPVAGIGGGHRNSDDERIKSDEAALRRVANAGGAGAFAVAQAAPARGRRQGPRVRRSASARRRARQRAGLEPADDDAGLNSGVISDVNPEELMAADVEMDQMIVEEDEEGEALGFWQMDRTDKMICGGICCLVVCLIVILAVALT
ncbi:hypothetical protein ACHAXT_010807 [Thalassiosira profunda]